MANLDAIIKDLVIANRILAKEDVVDAYGHVSIRNPDNPKTFFISRSLAPELIEKEDIVELDMSGQPVKDEKRPLYLERFIHAGILAARPEINSVVHAHAEDTLPFGIAKGSKLRPVIHAGSFIGSEVPVWDIADQFGAHQCAGHQHGAGPRSGEMPRPEQCGADARPRLCVGGALADRSGAPVGLSAAQRPRLDARHAARRGDRLSVAGRDRRPQCRLQPLFESRPGGPGNTGPTRPAAATC